ncbi:PREDICTED: hemolymph lipopolysaccharide-binding protein-like [Ceratosolen solmsi marchali]|uniref:Hemolymph lipopolysaccharide-binding protein-like n=1 Tax=Ceratosolen solmsi marchali TaxID=326594 RepID=A0AAJ6YEP7_9HYME|nr:PREDICTED: hemolymph lipopolysaccharide-binding protein-like [Ceratosolen solmsi marchali]
MGAHLAVPSNEKEMNMIVNYLKFINLTEAFIGIHDIFDEGRFVTVHGVPFVPNNFLKWSTSPHLEPDNFNNEDCCVLSRNGFLSDDACTEKRNAICQRYKSFC